MLVAEYYSCCCCCCFPVPCSPPGKGSPLTRHRFCCLPSSHLLLLLREVLRGMKERVSWGHRLHLLLLLIMTMSENIFHVDEIVWFPSKVYDGARRNRGHNRKVEGGHGVARQKWARNSSGRPNI